MIEQSRKRTETGGILSAVKLTLANDCKMLILQEYSRILLRDLNHRAGKKKSLRELSVFVGSPQWTPLTLRRLMSYIYAAPILDVSRSHTTTQHSR